MESNQKHNARPFLNGAHALMVLSIIACLCAVACSGSSSDSACPSDLKAAQGAACTGADLVCADPCPSDCDDCFILTCSETGVWEGSEIRGHSDPSCFDAGSLDTADFNGD
jgi:hypothetical protein